MKGTSLTLKDIYKYFFNYDLISISGDWSLPNTFNCSVGWILAIVKRSSNSLLCQQEEKLRNAGCCLLEREIQANYPTVLKALKYAYQPAGRRIREAGELRDIARGVDLLGYPAAAVARKEDRRHLHPALTACRFGTSVPVGIDCTLFSKSFSTAGIAYVFNAADIWNFITESMKAIHEEVFANVDHEGEGEVADLKGLYNITAVGPAFGLGVYIDHTGFWMTGSGKVEFAVQSPFEPGELIFQGIEIQPGLTYDVFVSPTQVVTDPQALSLNQEARQCLTAQERRLILFRNYTQVFSLFFYPTCTVKDFFAPLMF